jgi:hypothetical protein
LSSEHTAIFPIVEAGEELEGRAEDDVDGELLEDGEAEDEESPNCESVENK